MRSNIYMEHANISVKNLEASLKFFKTAFPNFTVRGQGEFNDRKWVHFGDQDYYLALTERPNGRNNSKDYERLGINHIGFVVDDVNSLAERLQQNGYERSYPKQEQRFRIRDYFLDADGNEFEFVEYLSNRDEERNDYSE